MASSVVSGAKWGLEMRGNEHRSKLPGRPVRPPTAAKTPLNEVVCGAMMLAYERAGKWNEVGAYTLCFFTSSPCHEALSLTKSNNTFHWSSQALSAATNDGIVIGK